MRFLKPIHKKGNTLKVLKIGTNDYKGIIQNPFKNPILNFMFKVSIKADCKKCLEYEFKQRF